MFLCPLLQLLIKSFLIRDCESFFIGYLKVSRGIHWTFLWGSGDDFDILFQYFQLCHLIRCRSVLFTPGQEFSHCPPKGKERWDTVLGTLARRAQLCCSARALGLTVIKDYSPFMLCVHCGLSGSHSTLISAKGGGLRGTPSGGCQPLWHREGGLVNCTLALKSFCLSITHHFGEFLIYPFKSQGHI